LKHVSLACLLLEYLLAEGWFGPALSIMQERVPAEARGVTNSIYLFISGIVGSLSPALLGHLDTGVGYEGLQRSILILVCVSYGGTFVLFCAIYCALKTPYPYTPLQQQPSTASSASSKPQYVEVGSESAASRASRDAVVTVVVVVDRTSSRSEGRTLGINMLVILENKQPNRDLVNARQRVADRPQLARPSNAAPARSVEAPHSSWSLVRVSCQSRLEASRRDCLVSMCGLTQ
jgi:hypothetical protein